MNEFDHGRVEGSGVVPSRSGVHLLQLGGPHVSRPWGVPLPDGQVYLILEEAGLVDVTCTPASTVNFLYLI
jgi:hypothetical protein